MASSFVAEAVGPAESVVDRERAVSSYYPQINFLARRMAMRLPSNVMVEDLVNAGAMGLMDAMDKFDPQRGVKFGTYAEFRIRGAMMDELRSMDWMPRSIRKKSTMLQKGLDMAHVQLGRDATEEEVARVMGVATDEYRKLLDEVGAACVVSIEDLGARREGGLSAWDTIPDHSASDPVEKLRAAEMRDALSKAVASLPDKERLVVTMYYMEELNMREIGAVMGLTESRVSQLHSRAVARLRLRLRRYRDD